MKSSQWENGNQLFCRKVSTDAKEDGPCAKHISIPVIISKDVTANLHTSNLFLAGGE
jgi:hypothetical protein